MVFFGCGFPSYFFSNFQAIYSDFKWKFIPQKMVFFIFSVSLITHFPKTHKKRECVSMHTHCKHKPVCFNLHTFCVLLPCVLLSWSPPFLLIVSPKLIKAAFSSWSVVHAHTPNSGTASRIHVSTHILALTVKYQEVMHTGSVAQCCFGVQGEAYRWDRLMQVQ